LRKIDKHKIDLKNFFDDFSKTKNEKPIFEYFIKNSNLPGRRANLEMAQAFADLVEESFIQNMESIWNLCMSLIEITPDEAPTNNPREILPFCGTCALGSIAAISEAHYPISVSSLKDLANDSRWRMREAVRMGIERILVKKHEKMLDDLNKWINEDNWLEMRAIAAGVAYPKALENQQTAILALDLHKKIFARIIDSKERKTESFKILQKALCYTLSVVTKATPNEGFAYFRQLLKYNDKIINQIIKENLKKARLKKNFPKEVSSLNLLLK
jgi:hypothetical protein